MSSLSSDLTISDISGPCPFTEDELQASLCRDSFAYFVREFWDQIPGAGVLIWNWHLDVLCTELQEVAERIFKGEEKKHDLVINISPGSSKSSLASILFQPWTWTRMPTMRHLAASHTAELVMDLAYKSREVVRSELYQAYFPDVRIRDDKEGLSLFRNTHGGDRLACTVAGKSPTGFHGHVLLVDDALDPKKAVSEAELDNARDFMTNVLPSRKVDKAVSVTILVQQRLHRRDTTAVMLEVAAREGVKPVRHVCLPGEIYGGWEVYPPELRERYTSDGLMDPRRLPRSVLKEFEATLGPYSYSAQFGQHPVPMGGGMFKSTYFNNRVKAAPYQARRIRYWDRASSISESACFTSGILMSKDEIGNYFIEDMVRGRWEPDERNQTMRATALRDRARYGPKNEPTIFVEAEGGSSGRDAWKGVARALDGFMVREDKVTGAKDARAEPWSCQLAAGNVAIVDDGTGSWDINYLIQEHLLFKPEANSRLGRWKDVIDSCCLLSGTLVETSTGPRPIELVMPGDLVLTRLGFREVTWSGCSGHVDQVVSVLFSNGAILTGTFNHPVLTQDRGWVILGELSGADKVFTLPEENASWPAILPENVTSAERPTEGLRDRCAAHGNVLPSGGGTKRGGSTSTRQWSSMGWSITEGFRMENTFGVGLVNNHSTVPCGNTIMVASPLATMCITLTETLPTIQLTILNASPQRSMSRSILNGVTGMDRRNISPVFERWLRNGIALMRGESGILQTASTPGKGENTRSIPASSAERCSGRGVQDAEMVGNLATVLDNVQTGIGGNTDRGRRRKRLASTAVGYSMEPSEFAAAPVSVEPSIGGTRPVAVYNLQVDGLPEFFANGVLVHNSGAYNLLAGSLSKPTLRTYSLGRGQKGLRIVICSRQELSCLLVENRTILVSIRDKNSIISMGEEEAGIGMQKTVTPLLTPHPSSNGQKEVMPHTTNTLPTSVEAGERAVPELSTVSPVLAPPHALAKLLDTVILEFADIDPAEVQDRWSEPIPPWDVTPDKLIMVPAIHGKALWRTLLKKRDPQMEVLVIQDGGEGDRRALSVAMAVCDLLRFPRSIIFKVSEPDAKNDGKAPNEHVYNCVKASRGMVM